VTRTRLLTIIRNSLFRHLFRFATLDGIFIIAIYAIGSYKIFDLPLNMLIFVVFYAMTISPRLGYRRFVYFFILFGLSTLTFSGILYYFFGKFTSINISLRLFHQIGSRTIFLSWLPYLLIHSRATLADKPPFYRWVTNFGFLCFKISTYAGLIIAGLSNFGGLIKVHIGFLVLATPCLVYHFLAADPQADEAVLGFSFRRLVTRRNTLVVLVLGLAFLFLLTAMTRSSPHKYFSDASAFVLSNTPADFSPSPFRSATGRYYQPEYLARSNGCGVRACHPSVLGEWTTSKHRLSVGFEYQKMVEDVVHECGAPAARVCAACHDPISLLAGQVDYGKTLYAPEGLREGISCLVCHALFAVGNEPANGSLEFRFPPYYYLSPLSLLSMVAVAKEHQLDFATPEYLDDRLCIACHRIQPLEDPQWQGLNKWLIAPIHEQKNMLPECRGDRGCLDCHMPPSDSERPGPGLAGHRFQLKTPPPAVDLRPSRKQGS
jgi:hypothetical protein